MRISNVAKIAVTGVTAALLASVVIAPVANAEGNGKTDRPGMSDSKQDRPKQERPKKERPGGAAENGKGNGIGLLFKKLGITKEQAAAIKDAYKAQMDVAREETRDAALSALVTEGVLSQEQADAIAAAGKGGMDLLVENGTVTREQALAFRDAMEAAKPARDGAYRKAALATLVSEGVISQAQADAIIAWHEKNGWDGVEGKPTGEKPTMKPKPPTDVVVDDPMDKPELEVEDQPEVEEEPVEGGLR